MLENKVTTTTNTDWILPHARYLGSDSFIQLKYYAIGRISVIKNMSSGYRTILAIGKTDISDNTEKNIYITIYRPILRVLLTKTVSTISND